jgi:hypothetical protein
MNPSFFSMAINHNYTSEANNDGVAAILQEKWPKKRNTTEKH